MRKLVNYNASDTLQVALIASGTFVYGLNAQTTLTTFLAGDGTNGALTEVAGGPPQYIAKHQPNSLGQWLIKDDGIIDDVAVAIAASGQGPRMGTCNECGRRAGNHGQPVGRCPGPQALTSERQQTVHLSASRCLSRPSHRLCRRHRTGRAHWTPGGP